MRRVALVTASAAAGRDEDETELLDALIWRGVDAAVVAWDDRGVDWGGFDLAVVRSTWDYPERYDAFRRWLRRVERRTRLANPADVIEWNLDKHYLGDLAAAGVAVVPTSWFEPGDILRLPGRGEVVVKPVVGAGARGARRGRLPEDHDLLASHAEELLAGGRAVMVQPYLAPVDEGGEVDLVFLDGRFSHAVRKAPALRHPSAGPAPGFEEGRIAPVEAEHGWVAAAGQALAVAATRGPLLYARVDMVAGVRGEPVVLELEVAEPALFLRAAPGALDRFAEAIGAWAGD